MSSEDLIYSLYRSHKVQGENIMDDEWFKKEYLELCRDKIEEYKKNPSYKVIGRKPLWLKYIEKENNLKKNVGNFILDFT